jgi:ligand-binding sensor domain-containing protein
MRRLCSALLAIMSSGVVWAQAHGPGLAGYNHAIWTASDGAPVHVARIAQTPDGWLWIGTPNGLYRFDGMRFHPFAAANGERLLSPRIFELAAQSNGDLYIGYDGPGLSVLRADGRLEHLAPASKGVSQIMAKTHKRKVMEKMAARSLPDLVRHAERLQIEKARSR